MNSWSLTSNPPSCVSLLHMLSCLRSNLALHACQAGTVPTGLRLQLSYKYFLRMTLKPRPSAKHPMLLKVWKEEDSQQRFQMWGCYNVSSRFQMWGCYKVSSRQFPLKGLNSSSCDGENRFFVCLLVLFVLFVCFDG